MRIGTRTSCACFAFVQAYRRSAVAARGGDSSGLTRLRVSVFRQRTYEFAGECLPRRRVLGLPRSLFWRRGHLVSGCLRASPHLPPQAVTCKFVTMHTDQAAPEKMFDELGGAPLLSLLALGIGLLLALSKQLYRVRRRLRLSPPATATPLSCHLSCHPSPA